MTQVSVVIFKARDTKPYDEFKLAATTTVADLKSQFFSKHKKYYVQRQRFEVFGKKDADGKSIVLKDEDSISAYAADGSLSLTFKDLGPQISWTTVFLVEYFGPLWIHPLLYYFPQFFYSADSTKPKHLIQTIALACVLFHYVKRELETLFVHRFSNATMPWTNIIKNSAHYWFLSGLMIAYFLYHPLYTPPAWLVSAPPAVLYALVGGFVFAELNNFHCHWIQRNLRRPGTKERNIPRGNLFELVSCANYTWECIAWLLFSIFTQCATSYLFLIVSFGQIAIWAIKKHKAYRKEFKDYPRRKALIPFLL